MKIVVFALLLSAHCELTTALKRQHFYFRNATTWTKAQRVCRKDYIDLSIPNSQVEITALNTASGVGSNGYSWAWIGLVKNSNNWKWIDGSQIGNIKWTSQLLNDSSHLCADILSGIFYAWDCNLPLPYFCYKWDTELIVVKENKSWEDALQYCRTHHTDLASLPTDLHLIQAKQTIGNTSSVWTGLRFMAGSWFWLSDEDLGYVSSQLPACPANYTYCGSLNMTTQSWENRNCMEELNFVCY